MVDADDVDTVEAGMANKSAVQYHFGSKEGLIEAILVNRLDHLTRRRALFEARTPVDDLRSVVEAQLLPVMELAEDETCYYLPFLEQLLRHGSTSYPPETHPLDNLPGPHRRSQQAYVDRVGALIHHVPQPLRDIRIHQTSAICLHAGADRHRARASGPPVTSYALHVSQLLDSVVSLLSAVPSEETLRALGAPSTERPLLRALP